MTADALISAGRNGILSYVSFTCLCSGAGVSKELSRKVALVFALSTVARKMFPIVGVPCVARNPLYEGVTTAAFGYAAFLLSGSEQLAKLAMLVKLASSTIVDPLATALMKKHKDLTTSLIHGGTLGILARAAGCSNEVSLAVAGLFAVVHKLGIEISKTWKEDPIKSLESEFKLFSAMAVTNWVTGMALKHIVSR